MTKRKTGKEIIAGSANLADKVETALIQTGEVEIEVRGLTYQEVNYARAKSGKVEDPDLRSLALSLWYLRFGIKSVQGQEIPREALDIGVAKLHVIAEATIQPLMEHADIAEALFSGIVSKTHNTPEEIAGLDFTSLFSFPHSSAPGLATASPAKA